MSRKTVLAIEDDEVTAQLLTVALEVRGFAVHHAGDGLTAWRYIEEQRPDLILLDLQLPDIDGFEFCTLIRALPDPALALIPLIMITSRDSPQSRQKGLDVGADGYLTKPISIEELAMSATHLIASRRPRAGGS